MLGRSFSFFPVGPSSTKGELDVELAVLLVTLRAELGLLFLLTAADTLCPNGSSWVRIACRLPLTTTVRTKRGRVDDSQCVGI